MDVNTRHELQWLQRLDAAVAAGDSTGELNALKMLESLDVARTNPPLAPLRWERFGRGAQDVVAGVQQLLPEGMGGLTPDEETQEREDRALYERGQGPGFDTFRVLGQAAQQAPMALLPAGPAGVVGRTLVGAGAGAASGAMLHANDPYERLMNTITGGAGGGVGAAVIPAVAGGVGRGVKRLWHGLRPSVRKRTTSVLTGAAKRQGFDLQSLSDEMYESMQEQAAKALQAGDLDADALVRKARAMKFGYVDDAAPTLGQTTRDPAQFSDEINLSKLLGGEDVANRLSAQRARTGDVLDDMRTRIGGEGSEAVTPYTAGKSAEQAVQSRAGDWQKVVKAKYDAARAARPDAVVDPARLNAAVAETLEEFDLPGVVSSRLARLSKSNGIKPVELERLDKMLTKNMGKDLATDRALRELKTAVRGVMSDFADEYDQSYKGAIKEAAQRFEAIGDPRDMTAKLARGDYTAHRVTQTLKGGDVDEIIQLRNFIGATPQWRKAQASVLNDLAERALPGGDFSEAGLRNWLKSVGPDRLRVVFGDRAAQELIDFGKVATDLFKYPAGHRVNTSHTATTHHNMVVAYVKNTPVIRQLFEIAAKSAETKAIKQGVQRALAPVGILGPVPQGLLGTSIRATRPIAAPATIEARRR